VVVETQKNEGGTCALLLPFSPTPGTIERRRFEAIVARRDEDAYDNVFQLGPSGEADLRVA
jgi:hypothetical protein